MAWPEGTAVGIRLRLMSWNVHGCVGIGRDPDPSRIAEVIAQHAPDVVALQELDVNRRRSGRLDQVQAIAGALRMTGHFHPALEVREERYGDAILSGLPMRLKRVGRLPGPPRREPRGVLWAVVEPAPGAALQVLNTHFGLSRRERLIQAEELLGPDWLGHPDCTGPVALLGDLNTMPRSSALRRLLESGLRDAQRALPGQRPRPTFPARFPALRLDHVLLRGPVEVLRAKVCDGVLERAASDHLPVLVEISLPAGGQCAVASGETSRT
ncbi:MAG: endonuclease/exonuclease/phosphatase family protein [Acetobacteraceae bacterium]|nr:endonuclease/exonuclease/phosphatase family protein [Acetobacteraceae bacterium]